MSHSSIAHPVSSVKCHTCSSIMPRPLWGCLGPLLASICVTVLLGCLLSSFTEWFFLGNCLPTSIPSQNTPKCIPHPKYPMMFVWAESFHSSGLNYHQYSGQRSSFQPDWTYYVVSVTLLQMVRLSAGFQKSMSYPLYLSRKMPLCGWLLSQALGGWSIPASWW